VRVLRKVNVPTMLAYLSTILVEERTNHGTKAEWLSSEYSMPDEGESEFTFPPCPK
jgi:hypothetical protein